MSHPFSDLLRHAYSRRPLGELRIASVKERIMLNKHMDLEYIGELIKERGKSALIVGSQSSLFPPPLSQAHELTIVDTLKLSGLTVVNNIVSVYAGTPYYKLAYECLKEGLVVPLSPPPLTSETVGGALASGGLSAWYNAPLDYVIKGITLLPAGGCASAEVAFNTFGLKGLVYKLKIKAYRLRAGEVICALFDAASFEDAYDAYVHLAYKHGLPIRYFLSYRLREGYRALFSAPRGAIKKAVRCVRALKGVSEVKEAYEPTDVRPFLEGAHELGFLALISVSEYLKLRPDLREASLPLFANFVSNSLVVACRNPPFNYRKYIRFSNEIIEEVAYRDVKAR